MKMLIGLGGSGMLLAALYGGDDAGSSRVYDMPMEQAYGALASMPVPGALMRTTAGADRPSVEVRRSADAIDWQFRVRGEDVAVFTVRLSAEGPGRTRVRVEYAPREPSTPELRHLASASLVRELARLAMSEHVEAELEQRPVDGDEIAAALARHAAANPEQVREYGRAMGEMVSGLHRQINENAEGAVPPGAD